MPKSKKEYGNQPYYSPYCPLSICDFLNELKIDYRGLIEKGEALSTEDFKEVVYE